MKTITKYSDIIAWQKAHQFVLDVYAITKKFPKEEMFWLTSQKRRATVSVAANIVEGFYRKTAKESLRFYEIAMSSLDECSIMIDSFEYLLTCRLANLQTV